LTRHNGVSLCTGRRKAGGSKVVDDTISEEKKRRECHPPHFEKKKEASAARIRNSGKEKQLHSLHYLKESKPA